MRQIISQLNPYASSLAPRAPSSGSYLEPYESGPETFWPSYQGQLDAADFEDGYDELEDLWQWTEEGQNDFVAGQWDCIAGFGEDCRSKQD